MEKFKAIKSRNFNLYLIKKTEKIPQVIQNKYSHKVSLIIKFHVQCSNWKVVEISWWLIKVCTLNECCNVGHGKCNCANKRVNLCNFACFLPELSTGLPFWWAVLHPLQTGSLNFSHPRNLLEFASEVPVGHHGAPFELKPFIHSIYIRIGKLHCKKTVVQISILSKLWYFQYKSKKSTTILKVSRFVQQSAHIFYFAEPD